MIWGNHVDDKKKDFYCWFHCLCWMARNAQWANFFIHLCLIAQLCIWVEDQCTPPRCHILAGVSSARYKSGLCLFCFFLSLVISILHPWLAEHFNVNQVLKYHNLMNQRHFPSLINYKFLDLSLVQFHYLTVLHGNMLPSSLFKSVCLELSLFAGTYQHTSVWRYSLFLELYTAVHVVIRSQWGT